MKKTLPTIIVYTVMIFAICMGVTFGYRGLPQLNVGDADIYRFVRGLYWFILLLPAILVSGFAIGCSIAWKNQTVGSKKRFSEGMFIRFGGVIIMALVITFILSMTHEVLRPGVEKKYNALIAGPAELTAAKTSAKELLASESPELAYPYALKAYQICSKDGETGELLKSAKNAVDLAYDRALYDTDRKEAVNLKEAMPLHSEDSNHTAYEMLQKAEEAAEKKDWFLSHYWASLAVKASNGVDTIMQDAKVAATKAWNELKNPSGFGNDETYAFYSKKIEAYNALQSGNSSDNLKAYYILKTLSENGHDEEPDIVRFLALAQEAVENEYFFIDETDNITKRETTQDIYFALADSETGTKNVYYIRGAMDTHEDGRSVRYLEGLTVATFSKSGKFIRSMYAPIAKVVAQGVAAFDDETLSQKGIEKSWRNVPFVMLQAVDRETEGIVNKPIYSYSMTNLPESILRLEGMTSAKKYSPVIENDADVDLNDPYGDVRENVIKRLPELKSVLLPMPYDDFIAVNEAATGPSGMDLLTLSKFVKKATSYGFSREVFYKDLLGRSLYPLFLLCLMIFCATFGWNYRIEGGSKVQFKFRWIFLVPISGVIAFVLLEFLNYIYNMLNYVISGACGKASFPVAIAIYVVLLGIVSASFLSRHDK